MEETIKKIIRKLGYDIVRTGKEFDFDIYYKYYPEESIAKKRFYNIGAGRFRHPFWTNIDHKSDWYPNVGSGNLANFDLLSLQKIDAASDTAEIVYSSHTVEHINGDAAQNMFNETHRILKRGSLFRLTMPNVDLYYGAYKRKDYDFFYMVQYYSIPRNYRRIRVNRPWNKASIQQLFLFAFASHVSTLLVDNTLKKISDEELDSIFQDMRYEEALDYCTSKCSLELQRKYAGYHISWWNIGKATAMLKRAGFSEIYQSGYGQSFSPILRNTSYFDNTHPKRSMYIEAVK